MFQILSQTRSLLLPEPSRQGTSLNSHLKTSALQLRNGLLEVLLGRQLLADETANVRHGFLSIAQKKKENKIINTALVYSEIPVLRPPTQQKAFSGASLILCL